MGRRKRQLSIQRLFVLTTALAAAFALAGGVISTPFVQIAAGLYFGLLVAWAVIRWPAVYADLKDVRQRRQALLRDRQAMADEVARVQRQAERGAD
jgi:hypothetical protein